MKQEGTFFKFFIRLYIFDLQPTLFELYSHLLLDNQDGRHKP